MPETKFFRYPDQLDDALEHAALMDTHNRETYFGAHQLLAPRRIKDNAAPVLALYCDYDQATPEFSPIKPTAVVQSSPGRYHLYARLSRPVRPEIAEQLNKRWALAFGADVSGYDLTQVLRVPGTHNRKYDGAPTVELVEIDEATTYDPDELDRILPKLPRQERSMAAAAGVVPVDLDDATLLNRMFAAANGAEIRKLWEGDRSGHRNDHGEIDDNRSDQALCNHLAFWTGRDPDRIDRLFRQSGLHRGKWERADYRERTIRKAIDGRTGSYNPSERSEQPHTWAKLDPAALDNGNGNRNGHHDDGGCTGTCPACCPETARHLSVITTQRRVIAELRTEIDRLKNNDQASGKLLGRLKDFRQASAFSGRRKDVIEAVGFVVQSARIRGKSEVPIYYGDREKHKNGGDAGGLAGAAKCSPQTVLGTVELLRKAAEEHPDMVPWEFKSYQDDRGVPRVKVVFDPSASLEQDLARVATLPKASAVRPEPLRCPDCPNAKLRVTKACRSCGQVVAEYDETPPKTESLVQTLDKGFPAHPSVDTGPGCPPFGQGIPLSKPETRPVAPEPDPDVEHAAGLGAIFGQLYAEAAPPPARTPERYSAAEITEHLTRYNAQPPPG